MLVRDEAAPDRYLERCIRNALELCDLVVILDDNSTDDTVWLARGMGERVIVHHERNMGQIGPFWGTDETSARAELWILPQRLLERMAGY